MINYLSEFNYLSIKLITCQNKLIADQKMIDDRGQSPYKSTTDLTRSRDVIDQVTNRFPIGYFLLVVHWYQVHL